MLIVDKSQTNTKFICTLYEMNPVTTGSTLEVYNTFDNTTFQFTLPADTSLYPDRYNEFIFSTTTFSGLSEGQYTYTIKDASGNTTEVGCMVVDNVIQSTQDDVDDWYVIHANINQSTDDDYIVYNK